MTKHLELLDDEDTTISLPKPSDMWDLGRNGLCICLTVSEEDRKIVWYDITRVRYHEQYIKTFRGFVKHGWAIRKTDS